MKDVVDRVWAAMESGDLDGLEQLMDPEIEFRMGSEGGRGIGGRAPGAGMIQRILGVLNGTSFHRGLALGAMVGAAIAGSTLWGRIREARQRRS